LGVAKIRNNQIRPSSIRAMKRAGKDDRFIMSVTGHKCPITLRNYDPEPEIEERIDAADAIMSVNPKKPKIRIDTVTTTQIQKTVSRTSVHRESIDVRNAGGRGAFLHQIAEKGESLEKLNKS
jgi:hypothetical protein